VYSFFYSFFRVHTHIIIYSIMWTTRRRRRPSGRKWFQRIYDFIYRMLPAVVPTPVIITYTLSLLSAFRTIYMRCVSAGSETFYLFFSKLISTRSKTHSNSLRYPYNILSMYMRSAYSRSPIYSSCVYDLL